MKLQRLNIDESKRQHQSTGLTRRIIPTLLLCLLANISTAQSDSSARQALETAAMTALQQQWQDSNDRIEIQLANLDPRVQVPACAEPLIAEVRSQHANGGRVTVRVSCQGDAPWTRHIAATVDIFRQVIVARSALSRGTVLSSADLSSEEYNISQLRGRVYQDSEALKGMELQRSLTAGTPLTDAMIQEPVLVERGETVVLTATRGNVSIRQTATAMQDGRKGQQISVRNSRSDRIIRAIVTGTGEADVVF
jgi:flagella basal body P-ring formation protein FlgA